MLIPALALPDEKVLHRLINPYRAYNALLDRDFAQSFALRLLSGEYPLKLLICLLLLWVCGLLECCLRLGPDISHDLPRVREMTYLYSVGIVLVLWFSAGHYHFPLAYHPTIVLYPNHIRFERDVVLPDQY